MRDMHEVMGILYKVGMYSSWNDLTMGCSKRKMRIL